MSIGFGGLMEILLTLPVLVISFIIVIVSAIVLIIKGKQLNKDIKIFVVMLLILASVLLLFMIIAAISFGNAHQPSSPLPIMENETESFLPTESYEIEKSLLNNSVYNRVYEYIKEESIAVFSPYYELLDFQISNYEEQITDGNIEATFYYKIIHKNYDKDPDTVAYIKEAKESGNINYQQMYDEYLKPKEMNFDLRIIIDKNDSITLYSNISPNGVEWVETKMSDYIIK